MKSRVSFGKKYSFWRPQATNSQICKGKNILVEASISLAEHVMNSILGLVPSGKLT
jgi:hypothetical protein